MESLSHYFCTVDTLPDDWEWPDITDDQWLLFNNWLIISVLFRFESESFSFSSSETEETAEAAAAACWNKLRPEQAATAASAAEAASISATASKALILH